MTFPSKWALFSVVFIGLVVAALLSGWSPAIACFGALIAILGAALARNRRGTADVLVAEFAARGLRGADLTLLRRTGLGAVGIGGLWVVAALVGF